MTVSATVVGRTPAVIGYNLGENHPGSNVSAWRLPAGCYYQVEEVSSERDGEISAQGQLAADWRLPLPLPATSVVLLALDPIGLGRNVSASVPRPPAAPLAR